MLVNYFKHMFFLKHSVLFARLILQTVKFYNYPTGVQTPVTPTTGGKESSETQSSTPQNKNYETNVTKYSARDLPDSLPLHEV